MVTVHRKPTTTTPSLYRNTANVIAEVENIYEENSKVELSEVTTAINTAVTEATDGVFNGATFTGKYWTLSLT